jgi:predicted RNA binding protein YcfA (HicA-like mRNA interferase family)
MKSISGKKFAKILEQNGWQLLRINDSHHIDDKPNNLARISVPIHGNQALKSGLLRHLLKVANLNENDL